MPLNLLQTGATWLAGKLASTAGRTLVYHRGQLASEPITGVLRQHQRSIETEEGFAFDLEAHDWIVLTADLLLRGEAITPRKGDRITESLRDEQVVYEVLPLDETRPAEEWNDSSGIMTIIHTKRVS